MNNFKTTHYFLLLIVIISWFMLAVKMGVSLERNMSNGHSFPSALFMFFSYFTILTNIFCSMALSLFLFNKAKPQVTNRLVNIFLKEKTMSALATSILLVGIIYYFLLFDLWNPKGWDYITDIYLHFIMPIIFSTYWFLVIDIKNLNIKNMLVGAAYPLVYFTFILFRGLLTDLYPYPFINIQTLGLNIVLLNVTLLFLFFEVITLILFFSKKQFVSYRQNNQ